jgi:hypothetical protein
MKFRRDWLLVGLLGIALLYVFFNSYLFAHTPTLVPPDAAQYKYVATIPITSGDFWFDWRPTTTPLLFKILGNDESRIVHAQLVIGLFSWLVLAFSMAVNLQAKRLKVISFAVILFVGSGTDFTLVYRSVSTEGIAYSLTALVIGAWLLAVAYVRHQPQLTRRQLIAIAAALLMVIFLWAVSRYPHSFISLGTMAILSLILVIRWRRLGGWRVILPIIIMGSLATFFLESIPVSRSDYWKQGFMNALAEKVLPDPDKTAFFVERGMPSGPEAMKYAGYVPARYAGPWEPIFDDWLEGEARRAYFVDYLLLRPFPRLMELGENWQKVFSPNIPLWFLSRKSPNGDLNQWRQNVHSLYYDPSSFAYFVAGILSLGLLLMILFRQRKLESPYIPPLVVLALALPTAYMNWYGDAYYERVFIGVSLQVKVGVMLLALLSLDRLLASPQPLSIWRGAFKDVSPSQQERWVGGEAVQLIASLLVLVALVEVAFGFAAIRNQIAYPILSRIAPDTNVFRYWDVSDLEYHVFQHAPIGEPVMSLQQNVIDGQVYYREYMVYWAEAGMNGELRDDRPDDPVELAWRNTPVSYDIASPGGAVFGGQPFDTGRGASLKAWQETRLPGNLLDAGIHYLHVNTAVWETLPAFQVGVLRNPAFYQLVDDWQDDSHAAPQHLYRIVSDVRGWTPPESLANLPLGLSEENHTAYQNHVFDVVEPDAVIFNPASGEAFSREMEINRLASLVAYTNPDSESLDQLFDLLTIFQAMQFEDELTQERRTSVTQWRGSKLPADLAGIDYLFFEMSWAGWLSEAEVAILSNSDNYELAAEWYGITPNRYVLLRVKND